MQLHPAAPIGFPRNFSAKVSAKASEPGRSPHPSTFHPLPFTLYPSTLISKETHAQVLQKVKGDRQCQLDIPGKSGQYTLYEVIDIERQTLVTKEHVRNKTWNF